MDRDRERQTDRQTWHKVILRMATMIRIYK